MTANAISILPKISKGTISINGITFQIIESMTPDQVEAAGRKHSARHMRESGIAREIVASRGKGTCLYLITEFTNGVFTGWRKSAA